MLESILYAGTTAAWGVMAYTDLRERRISDQLVVPVILAWVVVYPMLFDTSWWMGIAGAAAGYATVFPMAMLQKNGRQVAGWGDAKMMASVGAAAGPIGAGIGFLAAGLLYVLASLASDRRRIRYVPFAVFIVPGAVVAAHWAMSTL